ncbi:hypothetical protein DV515_00012430 [Chloebia gouldiae]|uniref:Uncharacterized protein n=1 Tax=Chloebia gouldiae TaxID=44316 RepID=A0A3L8S3K2_CHLGU|nr:hypothetical protein DV515_00012430 [Chloebia gouldiae]
MGGAARGGAAADWRSAVHSCRAARGGAEPPPAALRCCGAGGQRRLGGLGPAAQLVIEAKLGRTEQRLTFAKGLGEQ